MNNLKLYLGGLITGQNGRNVVEYFNDTADILTGFGYDVLHPMIGKEFIAKEDVVHSGGYKTPLGTEQAIYKRDMWMVDWADIVYFDLTQAKVVSIGCVSELAVASYLNKYSVVVMPQTNNIHSHAFINSEVSALFEGEAQAFGYLKLLANRGAR